MAARLQSRLQPPLGRALGAPCRSWSSAGSWGRLSSAPALPPPPPPPLVAAARPIVACCSAGPVSQPAEPQPDKQPSWQFKWKGLLHTVAFAVLSPILVPAYILLVDPQPVHNPSKPGWLKMAVHLAGHHLLGRALLEGAEALASFAAPAWADAAAGSLLGNGRVAEVLAAHSILPVPSSPAMQICTVGAVYCYYRCMLHLEAWYVGDLPWFRALIGPWLALAGFRWTVSLVRRTLAHCIAMTIHV